MALLMKPQTVRQMNKHIDFQTFWDTYALKRDRIAAERAWKRLSAADQRAAIIGIEAYREDCMRKGIRMMYAQGYLNHRRWEDEPEPSVQMVWKHEETFSESHLAKMEKWK